MSLCKNTLRVEGLEFEEGMAYGLVQRHMDGGGSFASTHARLLEMIAACALSGMLNTGR